MLVVLGLALGHLHLAMHIVVEARHKARLGAMVGRGISPKNPLRVSEIKTMELLGGVEENSWVKINHFLPKKMQSGKKS